jgi:DNA polymerase elongation subunit (family B)
MPCNGMSAYREKASVQDCELCNELAAKLEILANNVGMANVCSVPLSFIFLRGQGVKIFSLVAKRCFGDGFLVPTRRPEDDGKGWGGAGAGAAGRGAKGGGGKGGAATKAGGGARAEDEEGYEGAIVLEPQVGMYLDDPVAVLDYNSLYPSSMISHNISHDSLVLDRAYDRLPGVEYVDVAYDRYEVRGDVRVKMDKQRVCRFARGGGGGGVLPRILHALLDERKATRARMEHVRAGDGRVGSLSGCTLTDEAGVAHELTPEEAGAAAASPVYGRFERAVLDGLQLALKKTANSLYGQTGAPTSALYLKDIAACTTAVGRQMILTAKGYVEGECGGRVVYGDSVPGYTPVVVWGHGWSGARAVAVADIARLGLGLGLGPGADADVADAALWLPCGGGKEALELGASGLQVWTDAGWTHVERVVRHRLAPGKRIVRVATGRGVVHVTDDHSLLRPDLQPLAARDAVPGSPLLHARGLPAGGCGSGSGSGSGGAQDVAVADEQGRTMRGRVERADGPRNPVADLYRFGLLPSHACHPSCTVRRAFLRALFACQGSDASGSLRVLDSPTHQVAAASVCLLAAGMGMGMGMGMTVDVWPAEPGRAAHHVLRLMSARRTAGDAADAEAEAEAEAEVVRTCVVEEAAADGDDGGYVYDLTTANHRFQAGIGTLVVHNTDSIFIVFDDSRKEADARARLASTIAQAQRVSLGIRGRLPPPHNLAYEKTFFPFVLLSKKRYVGLQYGDDADARPKQKSMGIALKRRDYAPIVKQVYGGLIDIVLRDRDVPSAVAFLTRRLRELADGRYVLDDLVISKTLRSYYVDPTRIPHWVLARRMYKRDPGSAPQVNDRIPYVFVETRNTSALMGERIEHIQHVRDAAPGGRSPDASVRVDVQMYIEKQIMKPCLQLLAIALESLPGYVHDAKLSGPAAFEAQLAVKNGDTRKARERLDTMREAAVERLLFAPVIALPSFRERSNRCNNQNEITRYFGPQQQRP